MLSTVGCVKDNQIHLLNVGIPPLSLFLSLLTESDGRSGLCALPLRLYCEENLASTLRIQRAFPPLLFLLSSVLEKPLYLLLLMLTTNSNAFFFLLSQTPYPSIPYSQINLLILYHLTVSFSTFQCSKLTNLSLDLSPFD